MPAFSTLALGFLIAGTAVSVGGQVYAAHQAAGEGEAAQRAAESQAQLAEYNAAVAGVQAQDARQRGDLEANRFRERARQVVGEQRVGFAAAGVDVGYGSTVDVQADATFVGELDALTARTNAAREAWGYEVEGVDLQKQADILRKEGVAAAAAGRSRRTAGYIGAVGTGLQGAGSILESKYGLGRRTT